MKLDGFFSIPTKKKIASSQMIYSYYPGLRYELNASTQNKKDSFEVLLLGASTFNNYHGNIALLLKQNLSKKLSRHVRIHNLSEAAHTVLDSCFEYAQLKNKHYDLVVVYQGINEVRANNCPPEVFKDNYAHYSWYRDVIRIEKHKEVDRWSTPFVLSYLLDQLLIKMGFITVLHPHYPKVEWLKYGNDIKTAPSFKRHIDGLVSLAREKKENILFMTFAYYVPRNYSLEAFKTKRLDYSIHRNPIELWGKPENVIAGINAHNDILRKIVRTRNVFFTDQERLLPKEGKYFNDICHLTTLGCETFVKNIIENLPQSFYEKYQRRNTGS